MDNPFGSMQHDGVLLPAAAALADGDASADAGFAFTGLGLDGAHADGGAMHLRLPGLRAHAAGAEHAVMDASPAEADGGADPRGGGKAAPEGGGRKRSSRCVRRDVHACAPPLRRD